MRNPNCQHFDFGYETYEGEKKIYCAARGGNVPRGACTRCRERLAASAAETKGEDHE